MSCEPLQWPLPFPFHDASFGFLFLRETVLLPGVLFLLLCHDPMDPDPIKNWAIEEQIEITQKQGKFSTKIQ
jgi:hypothetical protein